MIAPRIRICLVPAAYWSTAVRVRGDGDVVQDLIQDVLAGSRRVAQPLSQDAERLRLSETSELLEQAVLARAVPFDAAALAGTAGARVLSLALDAETSGRLLAGARQTVVPPANVPAYLSTLPGESRWAELAQAAVQSGGGIVEALEIEFDRPAATDIAEETPVPPPVERPRATAPVAVTSRAEFLEQQLVQALADAGLPVNVNTANHVEITQVFARFVTEAGTPAAVRITYADGSEGRAFPLRCLEPQEAGTKELEVRVALMSMRHLLLDEQVAFNWFRNREIDQSSTLARSDEYCYLHSLRQLEELRAETGGARLLLRFFHTGFEPAVVAFYRAVTETLCRAPGWLRVQPMFFDNSGEFIPGPSWPALKEQ